MQLAQLGDPGTDVVQMVQSVAAVGQKLCPGLGDVGLLVLPTLMRPDALKAAEQRLQRGLLGLLRVPQALGQRQCQGGVRAPGWVC